MCSSSKVIIASALLLTLLFPVIPKMEATTTEYSPTAGWRTSIPEAQGMSSKKLQRMNDHIKNHSIAIDGLVIIRHGTLVWETYHNPRYNATSTHLVYSVTKSFTSCLIGIALDKGYINNISQKMLAFFPDRTIRNLDERKQRITIENLLMMRSGMRWDETSAPFTDPRNDIYHILYEDGLQWCLDLEMDSEPGARWRYNTGASHILSGIITASTGVSTLRFAEENLFKPLGITRYKWPTDAGGTVIGGFDLELAPRDMAKFGYLYLHNGSWEGRQIVSEAWVKKSTSTLSNPSTLGYGYQWWTMPSENIYCARGLYNQMIYVLPDQDVVVAVTANMRTGGIDSMINDYVIASINEYVPENPPLPIRDEGIRVYSAIASISILAVSVIIIIKKVSEQNALKVG